ncbi:hypothetical protein L6R52_27535 [Myxococcota bacterium]|nr:hypothetical protein [Myxococcota bacterium]
MSRTSLLPPLVALFTVAACSSDPASSLPASDASTSDAITADAGLDTNADAGVATDAAPVTEDAGVFDAWLPDATSMDAEPAGDAEPVRLDPPPVRAYSGGTCPTLIGAPTSADAVNDGFVSAGDQRSFRLLVPSTYDASRAWPVVFAWHWLNASSSSFVNEAELETAVEEMGMIAVLPDRLLRPNGNKMYLFDWPFVETNNAEKELVFFDDLLACVSEQYNVDPRRVYGIGVSAGALWLTYLMSTDRIDYLAAAESLSGGLGAVGGVWSIPFTPRNHLFPAVVLWGGPDDWLGASQALGIDFEAASIRLRDALRANGQFVVACTHDRGHTVPPITAPAGSGTRFWSLWRFMLDHPYGTRPSPYEAAGLPTGFPDWCAIAP